MNRGAEGRRRAARGISAYSLRNRPRGFRGFTLIEVLLAMTILAIILAAIYGSFSTAGRNVAQAEASRDETDLARTLMSRLSDDIANAYFVQSTTLPLIFYGKKDEAQGETETVRHDSLTMTTLTNWRRPGTKEMDLWEIGYFFKEKEDGTGYGFFRREKRDISKDMPALEGGVEFEITDKAAALQFRFYDGTVNKWVDEWDSRKTPKLPQAVEITLTLDSGRVFMTQVDTGR